MTANFTSRQELPTYLEKKHEGTIQTNRVPVFTYLKGMTSKELIVTLVAEKTRQINPLFVRNAISSIIGNTIFFDSLSTPFISSTERTGATIFRRELNFPRNRLLEAIGRADHKSDPRELLSKPYQDYPIPIEETVGLIHQLEGIAKKQSFIAKEHPEVLKIFAGISGGEYTITQDGQLYYIPEGMRRGLTIIESSSSVRSLLDIGFYLRHIVQKGELLMVDEPELNLHPANQRRIARLFARLVNLGVKVFITTHSDYIVKELNTLIMLKQEKPHLEKLPRITVIVNLS